MPLNKRGDKMNLADYEDLDLNPKSKRNYKIIKVPVVKIQKCYEVAKDRRDLHKHHKSQNIFKTNSEYIGLLGECGYGITKNKEPDWSRLICGDKYDFKFGEAYIDVKSTEDGYVSLVGWLRGTEVDDTIKDQYNENKKNGFIPEDHFKDMVHLDQVINEINNKPNKTNYYKV